VKCDNMAFFKYRSRCSNWEMWHSSSLCTIVGEVEWAGRDGKWLAGSLWVWTVPDLRSYSIGTTCGQRGNQCKCNAGIRYCVLEVSSCECLSWIHSWCSYSGAKRFNWYSPKSTRNRWAFPEKNNCSGQANLKRDFNSFSLSHGDTLCTAWLKNGSQYSNRSVNPKSEPEQYKCPSWHRKHILTSMSIKTNYKYDMIKVQKMSQCFKALRQVPMSKRCSKYLKRCLWLSIEF